MDALRVEILRGIGRELRATVAPELTSPDARHQVDFAIRFLNRLAAEAVAVPALARSVGPALAGAADVGLKVLEDERRDVGLQRRALEDLRASGDFATLESVSALRSLLTQLVGDLTALPHSESIGTALKQLVQTDARWCTAIGKIQAEADASYDSAPPVTRPVTPATGTEPVTPATGTEPVTTAAGTEPVTTAARISAEALTRYLRLRFPDEPEIRCIKAAVLPGGFSKRTVFVSVRGSRHLRTEMALRQDAEHDHLGIGTSVVDEYPVLRVVTAGGIPAPKPVYLESARTELGPPFVLTDLLAGAQAGTFGNWGSPSRPLAEGMAQILAKLHAIDLTRAELPDPLRGRAPEERFIHKVDVYWSKWRDATPEPSPLVEFAFGWVKQESLASGLGAPSIVHGDFGPHNVLCSNGRITGVVDWELVDIGDPAEDLAFCRSSVEKLMAWNEFLDIYYSCGGRRIDERRLKLFTVFGALKGLAFCGRMERTFLDGRVPGFAYGASAFAIMRSLQWQLATTLQLATGMPVEELTS